MIVRSWRASNEKDSTIPPPGPIECTRCSCGRTYTDTEWAALPSRRFWLLDTVRAEIAECASCGSTISREVP